MSLYQKFCRLYKMKKQFLIAGLIFVTFQISVIFIRPFFASDLIKSRTSNLTSLMIPFEHINRNSTFSCSEVTLYNQYKLEFHQLAHYHLSQSYEQPSINRSSTISLLPGLPYFYSLWKTSTLLPRLITPCEHQVYVNLIKTFDQICQQNDIGIYD